jgi:hypothetical protein
LVEESNLKCQCAVYLPSIKTGKTMKSKIYKLTAGFVFVTVMALAQREIRSVGTFTKISFRTPGKLFLRQGTPQKVEVEGSKAALAKIETKIESDRLIIETEQKWFNWSWNDEDKITVYVTVKDINSLSVSGSGDLIAETKIITTNIDLKVSGSGSLIAEVEASGEGSANVSGSGDMEIKGRFKSYESDVSGSGKIELEASILGKADFHVSGSGKIIASGKAETAKTAISGSGKVLASNLEVDTCEVRISGSGDVEVNVKSALDASISGSGSVSYKGNPSHINSHSSGSGSVRKM